MGLILPKSGLKFPHVAAGGGASYLDSVISSVCCDLDATISASYGGSGQTWANLIASPADTASQTAYDFYLGADGSSSTDDPTFTGSAGDAAAYFACDGGDYFTLKTLSSAVPTLWNLQKSNQTFWFASAFKTPTSGTWSATRGFFGDAWTTSNKGFLCYSNTAESLNIGIAHGSGVVTQNQGTALFANDTDYLLIVSVDTTTTTNNVKSWINTTTATTNSKTYTATATDADGNFHVGALSNAGTVQGIAQSGVRIYHFSCGNEFLDDTKAGNIFAHLESRHSRDYTP